MKVKELYEYFDSLFFRELSCEWDNDGLMCALDLDREIKKVLVTLDASQAAADYAIAGGFDVMISHHPLIFKPLASIRADKNKKIVDLIKNDVAVMSFHTRLDAVSGGVNDNFAKLLGLADTYAFGPLGEAIGRVGTLDSEISLSEFAKKVKSALSCEKILVSSADRPVKKVAILGGDGKDFVIPAVMEGADTYVSGRMSYNLMAEAREMGINLIEAGHFYTEDHICEYIREKIAELDPRIITEHFCSNEIEMI